MELQPRELIQEVNFVYDVLDIGFVLKSKTIITDLVKKRINRKSLETTKLL